MNRHGMLSMESGMNVGVDVFNIDIRESGVLNLSQFFDAKMSGSG